MDDRSRLAQMLASGPGAPPQGFDNPASLRLQYLAHTLPPTAPESTRAALAAGTLPPIIEGVEGPDGTFTAEGSPLSVKFPAFTPQSRPWYENAWNMFTR